MKNSSKKIACMNNFINSVSMDELNDKISLDIRAHLIDKLWIARNQAVYKPLNSKIKFDKYL